MYICLLAAALLSAVTASSQSLAAMSGNRMLHFQAHRGRSTAEDHPGDTAQNPVIPTEVCCLPFGTYLLAVVRAGVSGKFVLIKTIAHYKVPNHDEALHAQ